MNKQIKKKWVDALRENSSRQCKGVYGQGNGRNWQVCAIGMLHRIKARIEKKKFRPLEMSEVEEWCGLSLQDQRKLIQLNDSGWTFDRIAAYVEKKF